jgi:hypothetical protein
MSTNDSISIEHWKIIARRNRFCILPRVSDNAALTRIVSVKFDPLIAQTIFRFSMIDEAKDSVL